MSSLEDIKKKLNIEEMDKESRKIMFNKFVEKGGEVIKETSENKQGMTFNRSRQIEINKQIQQREDELKSKWEKKSNTTQKSGTGSGIQSNKKTIKYPFTIFIKGIFQGVFTLTGQFNKNFTSYIDTEFQDIISGLNFATSQILKLDDENKWKMIEFINGQFGLSYELLMRIYDIYKINNISQIQKYMKSDGNIQCTPILRNIHTFYKDTVLIYPYWETNKDLIWKAIGYYEKLTGNKSILTRAKINKYIDRLFNYYLPFFHTTLSYNLGENVPFEYEAMKLFAQITNEDDIGTYTSSLAKEKEEYLERLRKEKEESLKKIQDSVDQKEMERIPSYIQKGLKLIDDIISKKELILRNDKNKSIFEPNEKMCIFYILFNEFDKHYSFMLTTSQLKLTTRSESGVRTDIRTELDEEFIKFSEISNLINEYNALLSELQTIKIDFQDNPMQQQIKINNINVKRYNVFNEVKSRAGHFFKALSSTLEKLINDYKHEKLLLQNPEDLLSFQLSREKNRFDNIPIIKAVAAAFTFTAAIHYYISCDEFSQKSLFFEAKRDEEDNSQETEDT